MVRASGFIDFYEVLEISPNANSDTINRIFRYLPNAIIPTILTAAIAPASMLLWKLQYTQRPSEPRALRYSA